MPIVVINQEISLEVLQDQPELFDPPPGPAPVQLDLFDADECTQGGQNAKVAQCRSYLT